MGTVLALDITSCTISGVETDADFYSFPEAPRLAL